MVAGVLNNTVESSEETKVVREVTEIFVHEEFNDITLINDIAILKVGIIFKYEKQIFYITLVRKHICYSNRTLLVQQRAIAGVRCGQFGTVCLKFKLSTYVSGNNWIQGPLSGKLVNGRQGTGILTPAIE